MSKKTLKKVKEYYYVNKIYFRADITSRAQKMILLRLLRREDIHKQISIAILFSYFLVTSKVVSGGVELR